MSSTTARPSRDIGARLSRPDIVLVINATALVAVLVHVLIDYHIELYGPGGEVMSLAQFANALRIAVTAALWLGALGLAMRGSRTGTAVAFAVVTIWVFLLNGIVAFLVAPPPSDAFPYQDIAHAGGVIFGGLASYALWGQLGRQPGTVDRRSLVIALLWLLVLAPLLGIFASPVMA